MEIAGPLDEGRFLKRYKRFFADIEFNGETITAHVPNTGSLKTCLEPDSLCRFTKNDDPKRKLKYTLQMIKAGKSWVGVNTGLSNYLVWEAWEKHPPKHWQDFDCGQREVKIHDKTRLDVVLWNSDNGFDSDARIKPADLAKYKFHFIEVKNTTYCEDGLAQFPDAVTTRGQKHLLELMELTQQGHSCEILFTVQRADVTAFSPAIAIDPEYAKLLKQADEAGVKISAYACKMNKKSISLDTSAELPIVWP